MNKVCLTIAATGVLFAAQGCRKARPEVPKVVEAPAGEEVLLVGHATGVILLLVALQ